MSSSLPIISLHSHKGGVGKTTLALWIAQELAGDGTVLLIDADVVGTEVADLFYDPAEGRWPLGLIELLTQSTGGNATFESYLDAELRDGTLWEEMPIVQLGEAELRILPAISLRSLVERRHARQELARRFLVLDFAREQIRRRFLTLLRAVAASDPSLKAVIIDNSPFHVGLAEVSAELADVVPIGMTDEHKEFWKSARLFHLEVVGPDLQDILTCLAQGVSVFENKKRVSGWILNRDQHATLLETDPSHELYKMQGCRLLTALPEEDRESLLRSLKIAHVELSLELGKGRGAIYPEPRLGDETYSSKLFKEILTESWSKLKRYRWWEAENKFVEIKHWHDWLNRLALVETK